MHRPVAILLPLLVLVFGVSVNGQPIPERPVEVRAVWNNSSARPGDQRVLAVVLDIHDRWHINPDPARTAEALIPTTLEVSSSSESVRIGEPQFPPPREVTVRYIGEASTIAAYEGQTVIYLPVALDPDISPGDISLSVALRYQACNEALCLPPRTETVEAPLQVVDLGAPTGGGEADPELFAGFDPTVFAEMQSDSSAASDPVDFDFFGYRWQVDPDTRLGWAALLLIAAAGGAMLNFTPCVLPVIPIKIMSLARAADSRGRCLILGLAMGCGVVGLWLALGGVMAVVSGFTATNQLFQYPAFGIAVGVLIAVMAVGMCGLFSVRLPQWVYRINPRQDTLHGSVGFGVMTAVLSTPCTAPLMGGAAAWATTQEPSITLITFAAIGAGMALPYVVLSAFPRLVERMPRTGPAGELIKQIMGLLMLAAAAYFIGAAVAQLVAEPGVSPSPLYWWPVMGCIAAAGFWLLYRTLRIAGSVVKRAAFAALGGAIIVLAGFGGVWLTDEGPIRWVRYTPERFAAELEKGRVIVLDFTAEWCLNCKLLEHTVLNTPAVAAVLDEPGVVPMKVDITSSANTAGTAKLREVGRVAIPLLMVYAPSGEQVFEADWYSAREVIEAVARAKNATAPHRSASRQAR